MKKIRPFSYCGSSWGTIRIKSFVDDPKARPRLEFSMLCVKVVSLLAVMLSAASAMRNDDWWYVETPRPNTQQVLAYEQLYAQVSAAHHLNGPGNQVRPMFAPIRFDNRQEDPFLFKDRIVEQPNRDMGT